MEEVRPQADWMKVISYRHRKGVLMEEENGVELSLLLHGTVMSTYKYISIKYLGELMPSVGGYLQHGQDWADCIR